MLHLSITETVAYIGYQENIPTTDNSTKMKQKIVIEPLREY
jgi:hypothetical protein